MKIVNIKSREVLDSRGFPTVEVELYLENGSIYRSIVMSGASTGAKEALELRDNDKDRFMGNGVLKAVSNVNTIINKNLVNKDVLEIDKLLLMIDSTNNKSILGANSTLPVSMCACKYIMDTEKKEYTKTPLIMCNIINGGVHADNSLSVQEFMIIPVGKNIFESVRMASEVFHNLKLLLKEKGYSTAVGDEGGFAPNIKTTKEALDLIILAIKRAKYVPGKDIFIGIDVAASQLFKDGFYFIDGEKLKSADLMDKYIKLVNSYPIVSIEDPFEENDFLSFALLTEKIGNKVMIVGDDLFVTNLLYLKRGVELGSCNAIIIKPNQIGTITEVKEVVDFARISGYKVIFSHRSGDTEDTFIASLALYMDADYVKFGSLSRSERTSKYNELIRLLDK